MCVYVDVDGDVNAADGFDVDVDVDRPCDIYVDVDVGVHAGGLCWHPR